MTVVLQDTEPEAAEFVGSACDYQRIADLDQAVQA
jgi:hypothetical protein